MAALLGHDTDEALSVVVDSLPAASPQRFLVDFLQRLSHGPSYSSAAEVDYGFNSDADADWRLSGTPANWT